MAIASYNDLADSIKTWAARSDTKFSNQIEAFIGLAEDRIYYGMGEGPRDPIYSPPVRVQEMHETATIAMVDGVGTLPTDQIGTRLLKRDGDKCGLDYETPHRFANRAALGRTGNPGLYTVEGTALTVSPAFTGDLTLVYYKRLPAIEASAPSNALLVAYPRLYLTACLHEAFTFERDADMAMGWLAKYRGLAEGANKSAIAVRYGGAPLRAKLAGATP